MAKKICLDAGHYGKYNRSPVVPAYYESEMNWKLHLMLKKELESCGFEVITTRADKDKDLALEARGRASEGCDLFLSLHSNAADSEAVNYVVAMHQVDDNCGPMDEESRAVAGLLADCVAKLMGAEPMTWSTQSSADRDGNGYKDDYYGVLRGAHSVHTAGVIIEHGFHTNKAQATWLLDDSNLQKLAEAEAEVLAKHYGMTKKPATAPAPAPAPAPGILYRVQVGAYSIKANADKQLARVKAAGFTDAFIAVVDGGTLYRVQVGAYSIRENADRQLARVMAAGFSGFVTTLSGDQAQTAAPKKTVDEIAKEVIQGKWGNGSDRKKRLTEAGYDYSEVQNRVNSLLK